jgi:hypothetical protein
MTGARFHFRGRVGQPNGEISSKPGDVWRHEEGDFAFAVRGEHAHATAAWQDPVHQPGRPFVFVAGSLYVGSDAEFGETTSVKPLAIAAAPEVIARSFEGHGTRAFAFLDGDFSVVLSDPKANAIYLVVDKLGCSDIYIRTKGNTVLFASDPAELIDGNGSFDPIATAFLLGHQGFIPAPFTISTEVRSIGRARFARISILAGKASCDIQSYRSPQTCWNLPSTASARDKLLALLSESLSIRMSEQSAILLSGGVDSTVILNLAASRQKHGLLALTGSVKGWDQGEEEIAHSRLIAESFGIPHESVVLDPHDENLPEESVLCSTSWTNGVRLTLPLWRRFAVRLGERFGEGYNVVAGQTADTLADNNYTLPTPGYTLRRILFSSWFLRAIPFMRALCPSPGGALGRTAISYATWLAGARAGGMLRSVMGGLLKREAFYAGRMFGFGEMPGTAAEYFPVFSTEGFVNVVDWYGANFIRPLVENLNGDNFYHQMIQLSLDMNMLHLDSRLLFHVYRQEGGRAQLPFMDARVVTFFGSMPYSARAFYREPKHVIRCQLRRQGMKYTPRPSETKASSKSQEQLLLEGTLGDYYRSLLRQPTFLSRSLRLFEFVNESYFEKQLTAFRNGRVVDYQFISKLGALEMWSQALSARAREARAAPSANQA